MCACILSLIIYNIIRITFVPYILITYIIGRKMSSYINIFTHLSGVIINENTYNITCVQYLSRWKRCAAHIARRIGPRSRPMIDVSHERYNVPRESDWLHAHRKTVAAATGKREYMYIIICETRRTQKGWEYNHHDGDNITAVEIYIHIIMCV